MTQWHFDNDIVTVIQSQWDINNGMVTMTQSHWQSPQWQWQSPVTMTWWHFDIDMVTFWHWHSDNVSFVSVKRFFEVYNMFPCRNYRFRSGIVWHHVTCHRLPMWCHTHCILGQQHGILGQEIHRCWRWRRRHLSPVLVASTSSHNTSSSLTQQLARVQVGDISCLKHSLATMICPL